MRKSIAAGAVMINRKRKKLRDYKPVEWIIACAVVIEAKCSVGATHTIIMEVW